ncbi:hypothetical protein BFP72_09520 [Reichenbachiella sp. 5M10]|uniref:T9SS type B sorting domain-containing protein n=1 Tax=Reichenbachiella sp. 5M10 TaxID=1889772 RepID=UPI000C15030B|nr:gliding motility-associated C-terminal domain-containing protein [Reichenbachiella sp. 5M10]PIB35615.1 hypothetical protein BFP72_09520 [Reichenbachiella sp. 5M10]
MNSYRKIILILPLLLASLFASAQEICDDGIDNDGDGFIDCYDGECSGDDQCRDFYFGNSVKCKDAATQNPAFNIKLQWASDNETAFNSVTPAIGDIDGDGTPEVVSTNRENNTLTVLDGATGFAEKGPFNVGFDIAKTVAIANLNDDDCAEIFVRGFRNNNIKMYDCDLNQIWAKKTSTGGKVGIISLADFNGDGVVELLHGNEIRNAHTGEVIVAGLGDFETDVTHGTLAIDILPDAACADCAGLEIVDGGKIYSVNIPMQTDNTVTPVGTRTLVKEINDILPADGQYAIKYSSWNFNAAAVADYNLDGNIDVLFSGGQYISGSLKTSAFFWDVTNNSAKIFTVPQNHGNATGRINIADIDGDGQLNCTFVSKQRLYALDENMNQLWYKDVNEGSSGFTGCTVFDFNDDKAAEIIYRGENYVHIIDGVTHQSLKQIKCTSRTFEEYPVVADVDGDGASEICVACSTDDNTPFSPYSNGKWGQIRVFEADGGENWQPSRAVWNQHGYFNVNVNDDLTIPTIQQNPSKIFSSNVCTAGDNRPLNTFLNQAPYLNEDGCPSFVTPDIEVTNISAIGEAQCPEVNFNVTVTIQNAGDVVLAGLLPITFYNGTPTEATSTKLNTVVTPIAGFEIGETMDITAEVIGQGGDFELYISVNDDGSQETPVTNFIRPIPECNDINNIVSTPVTSLAFDLTSEIISHNENCDPTFPDNGDAKVYYFGTISSTITDLWDEDFEDLSAGDHEDTGATAWSFTTSPSGADFLGVSSTGTSKKILFADTDGEAVWETETLDISGQESVNLSIDLNSSATNENADDYIKVYYVLDGGAELGLTNGIHNGNTGAITATATGITGSTLKIIARANNNSDDEFYYIDNVLIEGITDEQTGEITAGFDFHWFKNNNYTDTLYTGNRIASLAEGTYQVIASSQTNSCQSAPEEITILKEEVLPTVVIVNESDLTNCETPDGELRAYVDEAGVEVTEGYDFTWYIGNDFTFVQSATATATGLLDRTYSVVVKDKLSGCESILSATVGTSLATPGISVDNIVHITDCTDTNSGEITVSSDEANSEYTFNWYDGTSIKAVPDWSASGNNGSGVSGQRRQNLEPGFYTVEVQNKKTKCLSAPITVEVEDQSTAPVVNVSTRDNESCSENGSGSATATVSGSASSFYNFTYYSGSSAISSNIITTVSGGNGQSALLLSAGQYLVIAEEISTGCKGRKQFTIADNISYPTDPVNPEDDIIIQHVTTCNGTEINKGSIDASVLTLDPVDTHEYEVVENGSFEVPDTKDAANSSIVVAGGGIGATNWFYIDQASTDGWSTYNNHAGETYSNVIEIHPAGFEGKQPYEGQQWAELNAHYPSTLYFDVVTKPGIRMKWGFAHRSRVSGTDCIALKIDDISEGENGLVISSQCSELNNSGHNNWAYYEGEYVIPAGQTATRFAFEAVSSENGSNVVGNLLDGIVFEVAEYYYQLYEGSNSSDPSKLVEENTTAVFENLDAGTYTIAIFNNISGCPMNDITVVVKEADQEPLIVRQLKTADEYCIGGSGTQRITATTSSDLSEPAAGYEFNIYTGTDLTATPYGGPFVQASGDYTFSGLSEGSYTATVTNLDNGCSEQTSITILDNSDSPNFSSPINSPNTTCSGTPNGFLSINVFGDSKEDYTWTWFDSSMDSIAHKKNLDGSVHSDANTMIEVAPGTYFVSAVHTLSGCATPTLEITVGDEPDAPQINLTQAAENTGCSIANGSLTADVYVSSTGTNVTDGYTFEWFVGTDDSGTPLAAGDDAGNGSNVGFSGASNQTITGLNAPVSNATYTLRVTDPGNCVNTATITLDNNPSDPVVVETTAVITDLSVCEGSPTYADGGIELVDVADASSSVLTDFVYRWYIGSSDTGTPINDGEDIATLKGKTPAASQTITGATTHHITGLDAGFYTVVAVRSYTGCESDPVTIEVEATPIVLDATLDAANTLNNSVCDITVNTTSAHDGKITLNPPTGTAVSDYTWVWYAGTDAVAGQEIATVLTTATESDNVLENIPGGDYTVQVTNTTTGCEAVETYSIVDDVQTINLNVSVAGNVISTPLSVCEDAASYPNGGVTLANATVDGSAPTGALGYYWYYGNSVDPAKLLNDGDDIFNQKGITGIANSLINGANTNNITGLNDGNYTVVILDSLSGCTSNAITVTVGEDLNAPVIVTNLDAIQTACTPALSNGQVSATASTSGGEPTLNYTFNWYQGQTTSGTPIATTSSIIGTTGLATTANLSKGIYTIEVINNDTKCTSTQEIEVTEDKTDIPVIDETALQAATSDNTQCGAPFDGEADATTTVSGGSANYSYAWYAGTNTTVAAIDTDILLNNVESGDYTLIVTDTDRGCVSAAVTVTVGETLDLPVIVPTIVANQYSCDFANPKGQVSATASTAGGEPASDYTFSWYEGKTTSGTPLITDPAVVGTTGLSTPASLAAGFYTIKVENNTTKCFSTTFIEVIDDIPTFDLTQGTVFDPDDCDASNGTAEVDVTGPNFTSGGIGYPAPPSYAYEWFVGNDFSTPISNGDVLSYGSTVSGADTDVLAGIPPGSYTVRVTDTKSACISNNVLTITLVDDDLPAEPTWDENVIVTPASCADEVGQVTISITDGGNWDFEWYEGSKNYADSAYIPGYGTELVSGSLTPSGLSSNPQISSTGTSTTIENIAATIYTVVAIDMDGGTPTGCRFQYTFNMPYNDQREATSLNITPSTMCDPNNGTAEVGILGADSDPSTDNDNADNYVFYLYTGTGIPADFSNYFDEIDGNLASDPEDGFVTFTGLPAGEYTAIAQQKIGIFGTSCWTDYETGTVDQEGYAGYIDPNDVDIISDSYCSSSAGNGSISVTVTKDIDDSLQPNDFDINWYAGSSVSGSPIKDDDDNTLTSTIEDLEGGDYTVEVIRVGLPGPTSNTCVFTATYTIDDEPETPEVSLATPQHKLDCYPLNGSITINDADIADGDVSNWEFDLYLNGTDPSDKIEDAQTTATTSMVFDQLDAGIYYIQATGKLSDCPTTFYEVEILDNSVAPTVSINIIEDDSSCGGTPNGELQAVVNGGVATGFDFQWYHTAVAAGNEVGTNSATLSGIAANTYFVVVTDNDGGDDNLGCETTATRVLDNVEQTISATLDITHIEDCNPLDGSVIITDLLINGTTDSSFPSGYTIVWDDDVNFGSPLADTDETIEGQPSGVYYVRITNNATLCVSSDIRFEILDNAVEPDITITLNAADTYCISDEDRGSGALDWTIPSGNYSYQWYSGKTATTGNEVSGAGITGISATNVLTTGGTLANISAGFYTLEVLDTNSPGNNCNSIAVFEVPNEEASITLNETEYTVTNDTNCDSNNGTITIDDVLVDGVSNGGTAGYTFAFAKKGGAVLDGGASATGAVASGLGAGEYQVIITSTTTSCTSGTYFFEVEEVTVDPVAILSNKTPDTNCTAAVYEGNGTLTIALQGGAAVTDYTFEWYRGTDTSIADNELSAGANKGSAIISTNGESLTNLAPGTYTVIVTDTNGDDSNDGCTSTKTFTINNIPVVNTLTIDPASLTHVTDCGGNNGAVTISDADLSAGNVADYSFTWYTSNPTVAIAGMTNVVGAAGATLSSLEAGVYYVQATNIATGCNTGQVLVEIEDQSVAPEVTISVNVIDTSCDPDLHEGNGALDWSITNADAGNYSYQWYAGTTVAAGTALVDNGTITGASGSGTITSGTLSGIDGGAYVLLVTDLATPGNSCFVEATLLDGSGNPDMLDEEIPVYAITTFTNTPNTYCVGNDGEIEITGVTTDGVADVLTDFTFSATDAAGTVYTPTGTGTTFSGLAPGSYEVFISHNSSMCDGNGQDVVIGDTKVDPTVTFTLNQANQWCTGGNGSLTVSTNASNPTITWSSTATFTGAATTTGATTATITGLDDATYTVTVVDGVTGCTVTSDYVIPFMPEDILIDMDTEITVTNMTTCTPANGSIEITGITPDALTDYTFTLHTGSYTAGGGTDMGATTLFSSLDANTYYIEAISSISGCTSQVFEVEVLDESVAPVVTLDSFALQTNCDASNPNGMLSVLADGSSDLTSYSFQWTGGPATATYAGIGPGDYTVTVTDLTTGCITTETYGMASEAAEPIELGISTVGNENCIDPNGRLAITVLNSTNTTAVFEYYLVAGEITDEATITAAANNINGNTASNLDMGRYTIMVLDTDGGCSSDPNFIDISDMTNTNSMDMLITQDHPLTKCDLTRADGQATVVSIPDEPSRYTFYWYDGPSLSDPLMDSTITVHQLIDKTYTVQMVDRYTGCTITEQITIDNEAEEVPLPVIALVNDRTNCVTPNGILSATINNEISGYTFEWLDIDDNTISSTNVASGLDMGDYQVTATDINTGCVSDPVTETIVDNRVLPLFRVETTDSQCTELQLGTQEYVGNGTADLVFQNNVIVEETYWTFNTGAEIDTTDIGSHLSRDERFSGMTPDTYRVLVVDDNQCTYERTFTISTDIKIFNGVSDNGDSFNDYFRITCADKFPNNSVKIFNRAGTLVYQADHYEDNVNGRVFTGKSNAGVGGGGDGLPAGTYFYIFDKGTGEEGDVQQGYLELVR